MRFTTTLVARAAALCSLAAAGATYAQHAHHAPAPAPAPAPAAAAAADMAAHVNAVIAAARGGFLSAAQIATLRAALDTAPAAAATVPTKHKGGKVNKATAPAATVTAPAATV